MAIIIKDNVFTLQTKNSTYQMKADSKGILLHTYYGRKTDETDYSYMISMKDRGFSGNIYEAREDRTYSLDFLPQEFPVRGSGDTGLAVCMQIWERESGIVCCFFTITESGMENMNWKGFRQCLLRRKRRLTHWKSS